jgi:hypothetical protein
MMFWQQSLGEAVDFIVSPWPVHRHNSGGLIQSCHTQPAGLEEKAEPAHWPSFDLKNYWGPMANHHSSDWIVEAICAAMEMPEVFAELLLTYIPHLDYDLQRYGPDSPRGPTKALDVAFGYFTAAPGKGR